MYQMGWKISVTLSKKGNRLSTWQLLVIGSALLSTSSGSIPINSHQQDLPRAKYATACVISDQGLHKPEKKDPKNWNFAARCVTTQCLMATWTRTWRKNCRERGCFGCVGCYENQRAFVPWRRSRLRVPAWLVLRLMDSLFSPMQSLASLGSTKQDVQKSA